MQADLATLNTMPLAPKNELSFPARRDGAVLLEVVLALALFVTAATIISTGLNASIAGVERLRSNTHAANLAVSVISELQLGIKSPAESPQPFEPPYIDWTWEVLSIPETTTTEQASPFRKIEVVIRREDPPLTFRLFQVLAFEQTQTRNAGDSPRLVSP
jgi:type II secretory pathway pseudopilin PulG